MRIINKLDGGSILYRYGISIAIYCIYSSYDIDSFIEEIIEICAISTKLKIIISLILQYCIKSFNENA
jgi:hypothetical protein